MTNDTQHFTPLPSSVTDASNQSKLPLIIIGLLIVVAAILGFYYYASVLSVQQQPLTPASQPIATTAPATPTTGGDEVNIFSDEAGIQEVACLDWEKYKARLDQIGMVCTQGCCPWTGSIGAGCTAPADGECKPKGNPCSDGTCWECRFEGQGLRMIRYRDNQWVSCTSEPTATPQPSQPPKQECLQPNQCLPMDQCETPPWAIDANSKCSTGLYCCKPKIKITPTAPVPSPTTPACVKPQIDVQVECLQCDGEAGTQ